MKQLVKVVAGTILVLREQFLVLREQCFCNILLEIWFTKVNYFSVYIECTIAMNLSLICLHFKRLTYISLVKVNHLHILTKLPKYMPFILLLYSLIPSKGFKSRTEQKQCCFKHLLTH